jgi:hypothetical protein
VVITALVLAQGPVVTINQPAANMRSTVTRFRDEFEKDYRAKRNPIPVFSLLYKAGITPVNVTDEVKLAKTADGRPRVVAFSSDGRRISSDGNAVSGAAFPVLLNGKESTVSVDVPATISADVDVDRNDNSLKITFTTPLAFHLKPGELGIPVPGDLYLQAISLSDSALEYQFSTSSNGGTRFKLKLDLTRQS